MFREALPRIYELHDLAPDPMEQDFCFRNLDESLSNIPQKLKQYRDIETDLRGLDLKAWDFLKSELKPLLTAKDAKRGWQALFDRLNQAKAYNYLKLTGFDEVEFIPPAIAKGQRTPDLRASAPSTGALCEVKTINMSDIEATRRGTGGAGSSSDVLEEGFFRKFDSDLNEAGDQMHAYDPTPEIKRIVYLIVNFDDGLHEYSDGLQAQINTHLQNFTSEFEVVLDIKPPFYSAHV